MAVKYTRSRMLSDIGRPQGRGPARAEPDTARLRMRSFLFLGVALILVVVLGAVRSFLATWTAAPEGALEYEAAESVDTTGFEDGAVLPGSVSFEEGERFDRPGVSE